MDKISVYVIRLDERIWDEDSAFRRRNTGVTPPLPNRSRNRPQRGIRGSTCEGRPLDFFYVGQTALTAEERFAQHMKGENSCPKVKKYGIGLTPEYIPALPPEGRTRNQAIRLEREVALLLQNMGFGVWWN